jgi:hypothetical protein
LESATTKDIDFQKINTKYDYFPPISEYILQSCNKNNFKMLLYVTIDKLALLVARPNLSAYLSQEGLAGLKRSSVATIYSLA